MLNREGTIEVNAYHTYLLALSVEVVDSFASSLGYRTHTDDYALSIISTIVAEELVFTTCNLADFGHVFLNDCGH